MRLAVVVQRYGLDINGGAELHARYIAEHLSRHADVEVLTTCARDYITWRNDFPSGAEPLNGLLVRRFPVSRERQVEDFGRRSDAVFNRPHSFAAELAWLKSEGPTSPALISYLTANADTYDYFIFFSYRYYHAYHGVRAVSRRALLVPTAERDPAIGLSIFGGIFRGARALMYNSFEERAMIRAITGNIDVPSVVVGVGSQLPDRAQPQRFRSRFGIDGRFVIYVGRIDENKGCQELFDYFKAYAASRPQGLKLVLIGSSVLPIPEHPRIRHLGFLSDEDKFDAMAAADFLFMPSYYESLSMVALEAWGLGRAVLANAKCDVLQGQCLRSNAGLYYDGYEEFGEALRLLEDEPGLREALGQNGRRYFLKHYAWPVIEQKYLDMLEQLRQADASAAPLRPMEPWPGWTRRWRRTIPPSADLLQQLPSGPSVGRRRSATRPSHDTA